MAGIANTMTKGGGIREADRGRSEAWRRWGAQGEKGRSTASGGENNREKEEKEGDQKRISANG